MMKYTRIFLMLVFVTALFVNGSFATTIGQGTIGQSSIGTTYMVDPDADAATVAFFEQLKDNMGTGSPYFGQHLPRKYGDDVYEITGKHPYIYETDFNYWDVDSAALPEIEANLAEHAASGYPVSIAWHAKNFVTGGNAWDTSGDPVTAILPSGSKHEEFKASLDELIGLINGLDVVVLLRLWHEPDITGFWWGINSCTDRQARELQIFSIEYIRDRLTKHNVLFVYSPTMTNGYTDYQGPRFPGKQWYDIYGYDRYNSATVSVATITAELQKVHALAVRDGKVCALTEASRNLANFTDEQNTGIWATFADAWRYYVAYWSTFPNVDASNQFGPRSGEVDAASFLQIYNAGKIQLVDYE